MSDEPSVLDEIEAGATAETDQLIAELKPVARAAAAYYQELIKAHAPEELARELVIDWHAFYFA